MLQLQAAQRFLRQAQVPEVDRVEGAPEDADRLQSVVQDLFQFHFEGETRRRRASERGSQRSVTDEMGLELAAHMAVAQHDVFLRGQAFQSNRAAGVDFVGRNADLRA